MSKRTSRRVRAAVAKAPVKPVPDPIKEKVQAMLALEDKRDDPPVPTPTDDLDDALLTGNKFRVSVVKDHILEYPGLYMSVYVAGSKYEAAQFAEVMVRAQCQKADSPDEADVVIFTGGPDVDPQLYGEKDRHARTHFVVERDTADINLYLYCMERGIPMLGVCRGAQFLQVMNGGSLYQDVDGHYGDHSMWDIFDKQNVEKISSVHHQMVRSNTANGMQIVATSQKAKERWINSKDCDRGSIADIEAFFYRDTCCFGVQGHPEYRNYNFYSRWWLKKIKDFVMDNIDLDAKSGHYRVKPDILAQRGLGKLAKPEIKEAEILPGLPGAINPGNPVLTKGEK